VKNRDRREFLQSTISATALATIGKQVKGQNASSTSQIAGANRRVRVALIGAGGMGRKNLSDFLKLKNTECVAVCDVDDEQNAKALKMIEDQGGVKPALIAKDFRKVLDLKELDAVIISTPDHWHAIPTIMACQAGKDVYVEKPLSLTIAEGRAMVDAARKHKRIVQVGTHQRSATHYTEAVEYVKSGKLGKIRTVKAWAFLDWKGELKPQSDSAPPPNVDYDLWLGPAPKRPFNPNRFHFEFRWFWDYSGGLMTDWGAHMIDIANWAMGIKAPGSALSIGGKYGFPHDARETPDTQQVLWSFPDFSMIWEHAIGVGRGPEAREHGVSFHGNNGVLVIDRAGWEIYPETERMTGPRTYKSAGMPRRTAVNEDYHLLHVKNFLECMDSRNLPKADVEIGHNSNIACHLGNMAYRLGRQIKWDVDKERVLNDSEAQKLVSSVYRAPWKLT
jgi:predicted dehydrogenase